MAKEVYCKDCGKKLEHNSYRSTRCKQCNRIHLDAQYAEKRSNMREDAEWLVNMGESWWEAARRVGVKPESLARSYRRAGLDVPEGLALVVQAEKGDTHAKGTCEACGGETSRSTRTLCVACRYSFDKEMAAWPVQVTPTSRA